MRSHRSMTWAAFLTVAALITFAPGAVRAQDVIRFGVSTPLSGPAAPWGIPHKNATELIFDVAAAEGLQVRHLSPRRLTLESAFVRVVEKAEETA